jgi:flagellar hook-associated protein FlgK
MISSNLSTILSHQTFMNNDAGNVANVNTDRYVPNSTVIEEADSKGSTKAVTSKADDIGGEKSQTNLAKEITDQITIENATAANVEAIRTQDKMLGSLLDLKA